MRSSWALSHPSLACLVSPFLAAQQDHLLRAPSPPQGTDFIQLPKIQVELSPQGSARPVETSGCAGLPLCNVPTQGRKLGSRPGWWRGPQEDCLSLFPNPCYGQGLARV